MAYTLNALKGQCTLDDQSHMGAITMYSLHEANLVIAHIHDRSPRVHLSYIESLEFVSSSARHEGAGDANMIFISLFSFQILGKNRASIPVELAFNDYL